MPIQIGAAAAADFSTPLALLRACHRRVEQFLAMLQLVAPHRGGPLDKLHADALAGALRYFSEAAPLHTADEEESLFPRLRLLEGPDGERARRLIEPLAADHLEKPPLLAVVTSLGQRWLDRGALDGGDADRFVAAVEGLAALYPDHIKSEDDHLLPLAQRALSPADLREIGREMAARRGVTMTTGG